MNWQADFFREAGLPNQFALRYALIFRENRIQPHMLGDLNHEYLIDMGILAVGDRIAILRHAKKVVEEVEGINQEVINDAEEDVSANANTSTSITEEPEVMTQTQPPQSPVCPKNGTDHNDSKDCLILKSEVSTEAVPPEVDAGDFLELGPTAEELAKDIATSSCSSTTAKTKPTPVVEKLIVPRNRMEDLQLSKPNPVRSTSTGSKRRLSEDSKGDRDENLTSPKLKVKGRESYRDAERRSSSFDDSLGPEHEPRLRSQIVKPSSTSSSQRSESRYVPPSTYSRSNEKHKEKDSGRDYYCRDSRPTTDSEDYKPRSRSTSTSRRNEFDDHRDRDRNSYAGSSTQQVHYKPRSSSTSRRNEFDDHRDRDRDSYAVGSSKQQVHYVEKPGPSRHESSSRQSYEYSPPQKSTDRDKYEDRHGSTTAGSRSSRSESNYDYKSDSGHTSRSERNREWRGRGSSSGRDSPDYKSYSKSQSREKDSRRSPRPSADNSVYETLESKYLCKSARISRNYDGPSKLDRSFFL